MVDRHKQGVAGRPVDSEPLGSLDEWDDDLRDRYPQPVEDVAVPLASAALPRRKYRDYRAAAKSSVKEFYRLNHRHQTVDFVRRKHAEYLPPGRKRMPVWDALEFLNTLVDDSDPDTDLAQIEHLLQTAEAIRREGHPRWFILAGLLHDVGKVLCLYGEPQWAVVGDTFPVGCAFSEKIVFAEFFAENPDRLDPTYRTRLGIYDQGCGLAHVLMSWGHDEYMYHVVKDYLPEEALAMIRYHSFYAAHREGAYDYLMDDHDRAMFRSVRKFNRFDLYTKCELRQNIDALRPFYEELIAEFLPAELAF